MVSRKIDSLSDEEISAISATVSSLSSALGAEIKIGLFGSRARRDHRHESDVDILCVIPEGIEVDWETVEAKASAAMAGFGFDLNLQILPENRMQDLYFDLPFLPSALRDLIDVTDISRDCQPQYKYRWPSIQFS